MTKLPTVSGRRVIRALGRIGFKVIRVRGSHHFLRHDDGRSTVVPVHQGEDVGVGLLSKILRDCEINRKEIIGLL